MWIVSNPKAFFLTFLAGLIAGFFLGVHAVQGPTAIVTDMDPPGLRIAALSKATGRRECAPPDASPREIEAGVTPKF